MKKLLNYILLFVIFLTLSTNIVNAKTNSLFQSKEKLKIENKLDGTAFLYGKEVEINEKINGIGFIAGEEIKINFEQDYVFLAGINVDVDSNINKDIFIFGENVKINKTIKRDAYIAGTSIVITGDINRKTYIYATDVEIKGNIKGNIYVNAMNIKISDDATITGTLKHNDNAIVEGLNNNIKTKTYSLKNNFSLTDYLYSFITSYVGITIVGLVLVYILEKVFNKSLKEIKNKKDVIRICIRGLILLICVPIISVTLLMTGLFTSLGIITLILYGLLIYISEIFTGYQLAYYIDNKWLHKKANNYVLIILGLFIIRILSLLPLIGGFITFIVLLFGLGLLGNMILKLKK